MANKQTILEQGKNYQALSIKDLLEARDAYHVFLTRKRNVVGTAVGKYRCRINPKDSGPKTLENTEIKSYSWPCVLVFVKEWIKFDNFGRNNRISNNEFIPQCLYMPDGREIPVCVIEAKWANNDSEPINSIGFPESVIGGGYPIITKVQGEDRLATLGCLVSDGRLIYGLTNRHVTGNPGEIIYTLKKGDETEIGVASQKQIQKKSFSEVYEGFPGKHTLANLDVGLIELNNIQDVTSQIFGIGEVNGIADINHDTLSLNLIGCHLKGFGSVSGLMKGEIIALFYRYTSSGGYDIVSDYLVGPRIEENGHVKLAFSPQKGDSGTLMVIDDNNSEEDRKAIGILWGGQRSLSGIGTQPYGLVTNLGTICRMLDVELVCNWNTGYEIYFGAYAHFTLPSLSIGIVEDSELKKLMKTNEDRISLPLMDTDAKDTKGLSNSPFVRLANVSDLVWKKRGGAFQRGNEGANHFADMDQVSPTNHKTLLELCTDSKYINPKEWLKFYKSVKAKEKGALPFRVWQIFDYMIKSRNNEEFVCAAGILTHYVFDACMPLHISYMHHGDPNGPKKIVRGKEINKAYDVHGEFDNQMVEYHLEDLKTHLPELVKTNVKTKKLMQINEIKNAKDAAVAIVQLMRNTVKNLPPKEIVKDFEDLADLKKRERDEKLWDKYGEKFMQAMAEAAILTARLWESAWTNRLVKDSNTKAIPEEKLKKLYEDKDFLKSVNLEEMASLAEWN
jgi:hypothetical protein